MNGEMNSYMNLWITIRLVTPIKKSEQKMKVDKSLAKISLLYGDSFNMSMWNAIKVYTSTSQ